MKLMDTIDTPLSPTPATRTALAEREWRGGEGRGVRGRTYPLTPAPLPRPCLFREAFSSRRAGERAIAGVPSIHVTVAFLAFFGIIARMPAQEKDRLEQSVDKALAFLKSMQEPDGAYQIFGQKHSAITSLAVMAFLSAGHVPGEGPYGATVEKGIRAVLSHQQANGIISAHLGGDMYHHGISTLMLAEVVGMTEAKVARELRPKLEKAVSIILIAQHLQPSAAQGGWRYQVQSFDSDMSVSGWQILALRAAKNVGCDVPAERIDLALGFVQRCRDAASSGYCYSPGGRVTMACTGTGVLAQMLAGKEKAPPREALQAGSYILKNPPRWNDEHFFYTAYYCSQATFQLGNNYWNFYRPQLHKVLFDYQQPNGSWIGNEGMGPVYATAMAVLALTPEYRFLPIYQRNEEKK